MTKGKKISKSSKAKKSKNKKNLNLWFLSFFVGLASIFFILGFNFYAARASFASGNGTQEDPFQITNCTQLQSVGDVENLSAYFVLINNIDCADTVNWNGGAGFVPIGNNTNNFNGKFNGAGFKINNLFINLPEGDYVGLFGYIGASAEISLVGLEDVNFTGYNYVGGLVGYAVSGSTINQSFALGNVNLIRNSSAAYIGGLVGYLRGTVNNSFARCLVNSPSSSYAGGLIGYNNCSNSIVTNSYAASYMTSSAIAAKGFIGSLTNGSDCVSSSFWDTNVSAKTSASAAVGKKTSEMKTSTTFTEAGWDMDAVWAIDEDKNSGYPYLINNNSGVDEIIEISTAEGLQNIANNPGGRFIQTADIDASATSAWNDGAGFLPIQYFYGEYDGNGFAVLNLTINRPSTDYVGIFSQNRGQINNLKLADSSIAGQSYVGSITGYNWGEINNSSSIHRLSADLNQVIGYNYVGGLVGYNEEIGSVNRSYVVSNVFITYSSSGAQVGGLIGSNYGAVNNCYARGILTSPSTTKAGGLFGYAYGTTARVTNSYAAMVMGTSTSAYGFAGSVGNISVSTFIGCFWDKNVSAKSFAGGTYIIGKLNSELKTQSTFTDAGWDMGGVWAIDENKNNGYPYLINNDPGIDPVFEITTIDDLQNIANNPGGRFIQTADIDASATSAWNDGAGFLPIPIFYGQYDDNGYVITNLLINRPDTDYVGIFGQNRGYIRNLKLADSSVTGRSYTGSVIGYNWNTVYRTKSYRYNDSSNQTTGYNFVGGLIGYNDEVASVDQSYAVSNVTITYSSSLAQAGGLIGSNYGAISNCYARGTLTSPASAKAGGLIGYVYGTTGRVTNSFAATVMGASASAYGFVGSVGNGNVNTFIGCFWDITVSGKAQGGSSYVTGKTTAELKTLSTFTDAGWDFDGEVWHMDPAALKNDGYPYLNPPVLPTIEISSVEDLQNIANNPSSNYILTADIDASATSAWNDGAGFLPIPIFYGQFDGNGFKITNLTINRPTTDYVGIFGQNRGSISNLYLADSSITGRTYTGSVVGYNWGTIYRSKSFRLNDSSNQVTGYSNVGGLVGYNNNVGTISQSYAISNVEIIGTSSTSYAGGLVGYNLGTVINCFAKGTLTSPSGVRTGGLLGYVYGTTSRITNSFSAVAMGLSDTARGFVGTVANTSVAVFTGSFWDKEVSNKTSGGTSYVTGKNTTELKTLSTFSDAAWDLDDVWGLDGFNNGGYAHLLFDAEDFEDPNFTLIINRDGQGSVTADDETYTSPLSFASGASVSLEAIADSGWVFQKWEDDSVDRERTVTMTEDKTLTAYFIEDSTPVTNYTLDFTEYEHGSITVNGEFFSVPLSISSGSTVFLEAISDSGWWFNKWENNSTSTSREILMDGDKSLAAYFYELSYIISNPGPGQEEDAEEDDSTNEEDEDGQEDDGQEEEDNEENESENENVNSDVPSVLSFKVFDIGDSKLWLVWTNPVFENFSKVEIYRSESQMPAQASDGLLVYQGVDQEYIDKNIVPGKNYFYSISVVSKNDDTSSSTIYHIFVEDKFSSNNEIEIEDDDNETENQDEQQPLTQEDEDSDQLDDTLPQDQDNENEVINTEPENDPLVLLPTEDGSEEVVNIEDNNLSGDRDEQKSVIEDKNVVARIDIFESLKPIVLGISNNPQLKAANRVIAPTLILTALANVFSAFSLFNLFAYLRYFFSQPASLLYRYKRRKWGVVYNSLTKQPIDLAIVRLYRKEDNRLVQSGVTDKFGRYQFLIEPGNYYLSVVKPGFNFPTKYLENQDQDISYLDLYHGQSIQIGNNQSAINQNIPVDPSENVQPAKKVILLHYLRKIQKIFAFSAVILAVVSLIIDPSYKSLVFLGIHSALFGLFYRLGYQKAPKSWGRIYDLITRKPLSNAIVRIYDKKYNKLLETKVASKSGDYAFLVSNNLFYLTAEKPGFSPYKSNDLDFVSKKDQLMVALDIGLKKPTVGSNP